ncbi:MAG TPA: ABC transporter substrate-binding protein [Streptosporangiaceae bacterium]|jgi:ribose transport system substrate-binding protein
MRARKIVPAVAAAAVLATAAACGGTSGGGDTGGGAVNGKDIAFVPGVSGDSFYITMGCGIRSEAKKYGLKINEQAPQQFDPSQQTPIVSGVVAKKPAGMLIAPTDAQAMLPPLLRAKQAGIKLGTVDTSLAKSGVSSFGVSTDNRKAGAAAADSLAKLVGGKGTVLVIAFKAGVSTSDERQNGFLDEIKKYPNIKALKPQVNDNDPAKAASIVSATLAANPGLTGIFATNQFAAEGAATGLRNAKKQGKVKLVGFDAGPVQVQQLRRGEVQALIAQQPNQIGVQAVDNMVKLLKGQKPAAQTGTGTVAITKDDLKSGQAATYKTKC